MQTVDGAFPLEGWLSFGDPGEVPLPPLDEPDWCWCADSPPAAVVATVTCGICGGTDVGGCDVGAAAPALPDLPARTAPESARAVAAGGLSQWAVPGVPPQPAAPACSPLLEQLSAALDGVQQNGALSGGRADTALLLTLAERARGLALRELAQMDTVGGHQVAGAHPTTTASWLRDTQQLTDSAARSAVLLAGQLRDTLPELGELLLTGQVTVEHTAAVLGGVRGLDSALVTDASDGLCALALTADPTTLRRTLRDRAHAIDDRLGADAARRAHARMGLRLAQVGAHTAIDGTLAGDGAATVRTAMTLAAEAARADGDTRGKNARHADVLIDWAADYLQRTAGPGDSLANNTHTVRSLLLIACTPDQLTASQPTSPADAGQADTADVVVANGGQAGADGGQAGADGGQAGAGAAAQAAAGCTGAPGAAAAAPVTLADLLAQGAAGGRPFSPSILGDHTPLSRGALRRLACDATLTLIVRTDPASHTCAHTGPGPLCPHLAQPLYVGRSARTISGLQFKALAARDRTCIVSGCHRPPAACAGHHVQHWADGGDTDLDNLVLLCHQHHHDHHDRGQDLPHHDGLRWLTQTGWSHAPT